MTIISQKGGNFWIESFLVPRTSISATDTIDTTHTLERSGIFLGCSSSLDNVLGFADAVFLNSVLRNVDNSQLTFGQFITQIESSMTNDKTSAIISGIHIIVWMKKRGLPT